MNTDKILTTLSTLGPIGKCPAPGTMGSIVAAIAGVFIAAHWGLVALTVATVLRIISSVSIEFQLREKMMDARREPPVAARHFIRDRVAMGSSQCSSLINAL